MMANEMVRCLCMAFHWTFYIMHLSFNEQKPLKCHTYLNKVADMYGCVLPFGGRFALSIIFQGMIATDE